MRAGRAQTHHPKASADRDGRPSSGKAPAVKALVLGASGHIGNAIARELAARGYAVAAAGRRPAPPLNLIDLPVRYICCDLDEPGMLAMAAAGQAIVVDAAAPYPALMAPNARSAAAERERARRRTQMLIEAVEAEHARLAYVSSFTTLPDRGSGAGRFLRDWIRGAHEYFAIKQEIEAEVLAAARAGLPAAVVNPTLCLGPWDMKPRELCFIPRLLSGEAPVTVAHPINVIDVREVAAAVVGAIEAERWCEPIALSGHNLSVEALYTWLCELGGVAPPRVVAPLALGMIATYLSEIGLGALGIRPPLPALAPMLTMLHEPMEPGRAQTELGIVPRPLSATLRDAIAWYRRIGYC